MSPAAAAATLSVPAIAMASTFIVVGPISDRWGRQLIMRVSLVATGVLAVTVALAPSWPLLLLARGREGFALAGLPAVALAYLREEIRLESHLRANSTYIMGTAVGGAAGRLLPGPLEQHLGWRGSAAAIGLLAQPVRLLRPRCSVIRMPAFAIDRADGRDDGDDWTEDYEELPGGANISIILESTSKSGVGPRLHQHPYAETFVIRRGSATFTVGSDEFEGHAGQILVVPALTPHKFSTGPDGYEAIHIHANPRFVTEWLE